jgi:hypothetical protein
MTPYSLTDVSGPLKSYDSFSLLLLVQDTSVGTVMDYWLDGRGSIPGRGKRFFSTPQWPHRLWAPLSLLTTGNSWLFYRVWDGRFVALNTHFHLLPRSRMVQLYFHSPIHLHGVVLNNLARGQFYLFIYWLTQALNTCHQSPYVRTTTFHARFILLPWGWRQNLPQKLMEKSTRLHGITSHKRILHCHCSENLKSRKTISVYTSLTFRLFLTVHWSRRSFIIAIDLLL